MRATERDVSRNNRSLTSPCNPLTDRLKQAKSRLLGKHAEQIFPCKITKLGLEGMLALCERRDE